MKLEHKLIESRPDNFNSNKSFTEGVMMRIGTKKKRQSFTGLFKLHPVLSAVIAIVVVGALSGASYAAVQILWPKNEATVSIAKDDKTGQTKVVANNTSCGTDDLSRHYEIKKDETLSSDELLRAQKADCENRNIQKWANDRFHAQFGEDASMKPGAEYSTTLVSVELEGTVTSIDDRTISIEGRPLITLDPAAVAVSDGSEITLNKIKAGDNVALISKYYAKYRNQDSCNDQHCTGEVLSQSRSIVGIVKYMSSSADRILMDKLIRIDACYEGSKDTCVQLGGVDVYTLGAVANVRFDKKDKFENIDGKIQSITPTEIVIMTSSGRKITIHTTENIVSGYNDKSPVNQKVAIGDTINVSYRAKTAQPSEIDLHDVTTVTLRGYFNPDNQLIKY